MKKILIAGLLIWVTYSLSGCMASTYSPKGVDCVQGTPFQDLPEGCVGR